MVTVSIIEPPVRKTGISSRISGRPQSTPTPERAEHLVAAPGGEVDAEVGDVDRQVGHRLAGVEDGESADGVRPVGQLADGVHRAEDVGGVGEREHLGPLGQQGVEAVRSRRPSSVTGTQRRVAPVRRVSSCHGMRLAWCSISVTSTSSPGPSANREPVPPPPPAAALENA